MGLWYKTICLGNTVIFNYNRRVTLISSFSDAIIFHNHVHTGRNIHIGCYKKQYSGVFFSVLYVVSESQNSSQCSGIEYQTLVPFIVSAKYIQCIYYVYVR